MRVMDRHCGIGHDIGNVHKSSVVVDLESKKATVRSNIGDGPERTS